MKVKELIDKYEAAECVVDFVSGKTLLKNIRRDLEQLDEPETGHADEAPRYLKNILARLRELPLHDREVWLKAIMGEFEQDFSHAKWREGYEQGKLEGMVEREKVKVPQFVADWIEYFKKYSGSLYGSTAPYSYYGHAITDDFVGDVKKTLGWIRNNSETYARAWLDGYEVEKEKKYKITLLNRNDGDLYLVNQNADLADKYGHFSPVVLLFTKCTNFSKKCYELTKKDVVSYDFGWVFDCPGVQIEEVE